MGLPISLQEPQQKRKSSAEILVLMSPYSMLSSQSHPFIILRRKQCPICTFFLMLLICFFNKEFVLTTSMDEVHSQYVLTGPMVDRGAYL